MCAQKLTLIQFSLAQENQKKTGKSQYNPKLSPRQDCLANHHLQSRPYLLLHSTEVHSRISLLLHAREVPSLSTAPRAPSAPCSSSCCLYWSAATGWSAHMAETRHTSQAFSTGDVNSLWKMRRDMHRHLGNAEQKSKALFLGLPGWAGTRKVKKIVTEATDSEWQWHPLGHIQVCTSLQTDNHASTPPLSFLQAGCPSCCQPTASKHLRQLVYYLQWQK